MVRKTTTASAAAIAAMLIFAVTNAEGSFANAQDAEASIALPQTQDAGPGEIVPLVTVEATFNAEEFEAARALEEGSSDESAPKFVANPVVQELPEPEVEPETAPYEHNAQSLRELVSSIPSSGQMSEQLHCLAGAVYFEARGEPLEGQLAVAQVVINRADARAFPGSYCGVVYQRAQFSFVRGGRMPSINRGSNAWKRAQAIARIAHGGMWDSAAQDSLYFHAKYVSPSWSRKKQRRTAISSHIFYR